jgi:hypothetical protein
MLLALDAAGGARTPSTDRTGGYICRRLPPAVNTEGGSPAHGSGPGTHRPLRCLKPGAELLRLGNDACSDRALAGVPFSFSGRVDVAPDTSLLRQLEQLMPHRCRSSAGTALKKHPFSEPVPTASRTLASAPTALPSKRSTRYPQRTAGSPPRVTRIVYSPTNDDVLPDKHRSLR